jgi:hypothetical protein
MDSLSRTLFVLSRATGVMGSTCERLSMVEGLLLGLLGCALFQVPTARDESVEWLNIPEQYAVVRHFLVICLQELEFFLFARNELQASSNGGEVIDLLALRSVVRKNLALNSATSLAS